MFCDYGLPLRVAAAGHLREVARDAEPRVVEMQPLAEQRARARRSGEIAGELSRAAAAQAGGV